jgi:succinyl-CoA synthetase alpha subunit
VAILVDENTQVLVQGITGRQGRFHAAQMRAFGTRVVAGISPGKGGQGVDGVPVYDTAKAAAREHRIDASVLFVPAPFAKDAAMESVDAGIPLVVIITEHIPVQDTMKVMAYAQERGTRVIGPNCTGIVSAGKCKIGIMPNSIYRQGRVGIVARSGTLSYQIAQELTDVGLGQTSALSIGGDPVVGLGLTDILELFEKDPETHGVVLVGEIGGNAEEVASRYIAGMTKPVVAYLAGKSAPPGKRMGHAGAIIERGMGTLDSKVTALTEAGARVASLPWEVKDLMLQALGD